VVISTEKFSLNAIGGFKMLDGVPSMFAYGVLDMPLGGPAFFYVEGLAAGFGLHRRLHMPKIEDVRSFPLVANAGVKSTNKPDPDAEFSKLHDYVSPQLAEYFFAVGIKFNSFRLLHGFALLVVRVGRDFEVDLIGTADFASPPELPAGVPAMASIELDLLARIAPAEGLIAVEARLNPKSYVYGPLCHLSGGFAFYAWTKGKHGGDFVLSVGGYHPDYDVPAHYPAVPRVAQLGKNDAGIVNPTLGITPAAIETIDASHHTVKVERDGADVSHEFAPTAVDTGFPAALWGPRRDPDPKALPIRAVNGIELRPKDLPKPGESMELRVGDLAYERTINAIRDVVTEVRSSGSMPTSLPEADLARLGLHPDVLAFVPNASRPTIELSGRKGGAIA
jgi:hypothetical protein